MPETEAEATSYPERIRKIGDQIMALAPAEARELNDYLETTYNIVATKPPEIPVFEPQPVDEGPTSFDVVITSYGEKKLNVIKAVRVITGLALMAAKKLIDNLPKTIKEEASQEEAEQLKTQLEEAGASVTLE